DPELTATVSAAGSTETTASGTGNETTGTTEAPAAVTQPVSSVPDTLTFSVTFSSGSITISGMFTVSTTDYSIELDDEYADLPNGSIVQCSSWYGKEYPVYIELDGAARLKYSEDGSSPGYFPPMTRYETDDQKTVLYNGGYIIAGEAGTIVLDMSHTGVQGQIGLHTESSDHRLDSEEFPVLMTENGMFFTDGTEKILLTKYELDGITPDITVEHLAKNDILPGDDPEEEPEEYVWEDTIVFTITEDPDGAAVISAYDAPAGTYRIKIQWIYSGRLLYSAETEIYVRYSEWQGGIST
ncbi:MAG: hypothetical protein IJT91_07820, partial [Clostridia bacterium]|nr:hypothetical protein [Clostridia bacterium]